MASEVPAGDPRLLGENIMLVNACRHVAGALFAILAVGFAAVPPPVAGQAIDGAGAIVLIPVVVSSSTFSTEVSLFNPTTATVTIQPTYFPAPGTPTANANGGIPVLCTPVVMSAGQAAQFKFSTQCVLTGPGSNYGVLKLFSDPASVGVRPIIAYSRVSNVAGAGFSIEAFPIGTFEGGLQHAIGLKRQAALPTYQTNCFVAATGEAVASYSIRLVDASGNQIGNTISGSLAAWKMIRYLDIFAAASAPPGDYVNVRAEFKNDEAPPGPGQAIVAFCTVQDNVSFGADFRIAKVLNPRDMSRQRFSTSASFTVDAGSQNFHSVFFRHPDIVSCFLLAGNTGDFTAQLEMRMGLLGVGVFEGGNNVNAIVGALLGDKGSYGNNYLYGTSGQWFIAVGPREGAVPAPPYTYKIQCNAGNGVSLPLQYSEGADNF
jgi:hypothetical protein